MTIIKADPLRTYGVSGPTSATDNEVATFDGTTGKKIQAGSGLTNPSAGRLDLTEIRVTDGVILAEGATGSTPVAGSGTRMMWIPIKAALRAGSIDGTHWDDANIGDNSVVFGLNNKASATNTCIMSGNANEVSSLDSGILTGQQNRVTSSRSGILTGISNEVSGQYSGILTGQANKVAGNRASIVGGQSNKAGGDYSFVGGRYMQQTSAADRTFVFGYGNFMGISIPTPNAFLVFPPGAGAILGNMGLGTMTFGTAANAVFGIGNGVAPTSSPANIVQLYAEDTSSSSELKVRDEAGNVTTLSPHTFKLFEKPDPMAWDFYSKNPYTGKEINVDLWTAIRDLEALTKKKYIYEAVLAPEDVENKAEQLEEDVIFATMQEKIKVPLAEAIEQIPIIEFVQEGMETVYELDKKTGKLIATERPKMVEQPTGEMEYKFIKGCETVAGKCYRRKNRLEATSKVGL